MLLNQAKGGPRPSAVRSLLEPESSSKLGVEAGTYLGDYRVNMANMANRANRANRANFFAFLSKFTNR